MNKKRIKMLISVVITTHNAASYIGAALQSILESTLTQFEVVIADDASNDETTKIIRKFVDKRIVLIELKKVGRASSLNRAVLEARGEFIAINDADDLSFPDRFERSLLAINSNPEIGLCGAASLLATTFGGQLPPQSRPVTQNLIPLSDWRLYRSNPFVHSTAFYRRTVWERIGGYDESLKMCIDYDFYLRAKAVTSVGYLSEVLVVVFANPDSHFKRFRLLDYEVTLGKIKSRFRKSRHLSPFVRVFDMVQLLQGARLRLRRAHRQVF